MLWRARLLTLAVLSGFAAAMTVPAVAQTFKVLYSFAGYPTDGAQPLGGLLMDAAGSLYGTTRYGGSHEGCPGKWQCGTVFKLDTNAVETVLHNFSGPDGANPISNLIMDANGDLYGTTKFGGRTGSCVGTGSAGLRSGIQIERHYRNRAVPLHRERRRRISLGWRDYGRSRGALRHHQRGRSHGWGGSLQVGRQKGDGAA